MNPEALTRAARQIALPQIGLEGQQRIAAATVAIAGDDLACETVARALAAAGVGGLRLLRRGSEGGLPATVAAALAGSNPAVAMEVRGWPTSDGSSDRTRDGTGDALGRAWLAAIDGVAVVVRAGFDDDPMMRAALRLGTPVVVMRNGAAGAVDVISFRRQGPCPHAPLEVPEKVGESFEDADHAAGAVVAGHLAAAEALVLIAGAAAGAARARHLKVPGRLDANGEADVRAADIAWAPECFACGGSGVEMSLR